MTNKIAILAANSEKAQATLELLQQNIKPVPVAEAEKLIVIGGDGFMLANLHEMFDRPADKILPIYGINRGSYGFLLNNFTDGDDDIIQKITRAEPVTLYPLKMTAIDDKGQTHEKHAVNEISLFRRTAQIAKLKITIDDTIRMDNLWCDGIIVATPAGSSAYNFAAHGNIVPLDSKILCLTPIAPFRPPRWRGALLPHKSIVTIDILEAEKRPVSAVADNIEIVNVTKITLSQDSNLPLTLLFDPDASLADRILTQQFAI